MTEYQQTMYWIKQYMKEAQEHRIWRRNDAYLWGGISVGGMILSAATQSPVGLALWAFCAFVKFHQGRQQQELLDIINQSLSVIEEMEEIVK